MRPVLGERLEPRSLLQLAHDLLQPLKPAQFNDWDHVRSVQVLTNRPDVFEFTVEEALKVLLDGSGFEAQRTGVGTYVIVDSRAASLLPYPSRIG